MQNTVNIHPIQPPLQYRDELVTVGSCFAHHIAQKLVERKFVLTNNPMGILFNPVSVGQAVRHIMQKTTFQQRDIFESDGLWFSYEHHGQFAHPRALTALQHMNDALSQAHQALKNAKWLVLTLGTAHVWRLKSTGQIVANCHKQPASKFAREILSLQEIIEVLTQTLEEVQVFNGDIHIMLSVSPVRYLRDGLMASLRSKARLLLACEHVQSLMPRVHYFPAYEIMTDELRDYSFYDDSGSHPNERAVHYIWNRLEANWLEASTRENVKAVEQILKAMGHRPIHQASLQHQRFLDTTLEKIEKLTSSLPFLDFEEEKKKLLDQKL